MEMGVNMIPFWQSETPNKAKLDPKPHTCICLCISVYRSMKKVVKASHQGCLCRAADEERKGKEKGRFWCN